MTISRAQHLREFSYANEHNCSLLEARNALARLSERAAQNFIADLETLPVMPGVPLEERRRRANAIPANEPWMMRD